MARNWYVPTLVGSNFELQGRKVLFTNPLSGYSYIGTILASGSWFGDKRIHYQVFISKRFCEVYWSPEDCTLLPEKMTRVQLSALKKIIKRK